MEQFEQIDWPYDAEDRQAMKETYYEYMEWLASQPLTEGGDSLG